MMTENDKDQKKIDKAKFRKVGNTRCYVCYCKIDYNDYDDIDLKVAVHCQKAHNIPVPAYLKPYFRNKR